MNNNISDGESQTSYLKQDKRPIKALKKFRKHGTVNLIRLKQLAKINLRDAAQIELTAEAIKRAKKDFSLDLPILVEETASDVKIPKAISTFETNKIEHIFYPYSPHRSHLTTRFGLFFHNDRILILEAMRTTFIAMLHLVYASVTKMDKVPEAFLWPGLYREIREISENGPSCRAAGRNQKRRRALNPFR